MGDSVGKIQESTVGLVASRALWWDVNEFLNAPFWDQAGRLTFVYVMFYSAFLGFDQIYAYGPFDDLWKSMVS